MSSDFTPDQKRYLEGFSSGLAAARAARTPEQAIAFVGDLKKAGRYQQDVY